MKTVLKTGEANVLSTVCSVIMFVFGQMLKGLIPSKTIALFFPHHDLFAPPGIADQPVESDQNGRSAGYR